MNLELLKKLIKAGESETLEFTSNSKIFEIETSRKRLKTIARKKILNTDNAR